MYCEYNIDIDKQTSALLCSAIISDTLILKSPTCTEYDVEACNALAKIADIDIEKYGREMFRAGSNLSSKTEEEIFYRDFKKFSIGEIGSLIVFILLLLYLARVCIKGGKKSE